MALLTIMGGESDERQKLEKEAVALGIHTTLISNVTGHIRASFFSLDVETRDDTFTSLSNGLAVPVQKEW